MKRITAIVILLAMLCPIILGCESEKAEQNEMQTSAAGSGAAANQTVAEIDIEPNEVVIETTPYAWGVKYLEVPEDDWSNSGPMRGISLDTVNPYYDKKENVIKLAYLSAEKDSKEFINRLAVYDMKGNYLRSEDIPMPDIDDISNCILNMTEYGYIMVCYNPSGTTLLKYRLDTGETEIIFEDIMSFYDPGVSLNVPTEDGDGNYYFVGKRYSEPIENQYGGKVSWSADTLTVVSSAGEILFRHDWDFEKGKAIIGLFSKDGTVYLQDSSKLIVQLDLENKAFKKAELPELPSDIPASQPYGFTLRKEPVTIPFNHASGTSNHRLIGNGGHDVYYITNTGIYGHNFKDPDVTEEYEMIVDFMASGVSAETLDVFSIPTGTCILGKMKDIFTTVPTSYKDPCMIYFDEVAAQTERIVITLAHTDTLPEDASRMISYFNMTTPRYRITTSDYSVYDDPAAQLMKEFGTGKYPDLLYISDDIDYNNLTSKGFMYNLYDLGLTPEMLPKSIRTMCEFGGGLYKLPMSFTYTALLTKDGTGKLTLNDLAEQYKIHGNSLFPQFSRDSLIKYLIKAGALGSFIDYSSAESSFNDPEFVNFLDFLRTYSNEPDYSIDISAFSNRPHYYLSKLENQQLIKGGDAVYFAVRSNHRSASLPVYQILCDGSDYTYCGLPTTYGSGIVIEPEYEFGITKASANPEGAMAFLRMLFDSDESDKYMWQFELRTNTNKLTDRLESYFAHEEYLMYYDMNTNTLSQFQKAGIENAFDRFYAEPERYLIPEVSDEELENFVDAILGAEVRPEEDEGLLEIFYDELVPFLAGQDTASNTANRINSRVGIYLAERYS